MKIFHNKKRKGSTKILLALIISCIIVATIYYTKIIIPDKSNDLIENIKEPTFSSVIATGTTPPSSEDNVSSYQEAIEDLETLGCQIINVNEVISDYPNSAAFIVNYTDFRKIAYNQKIVFSFNSYEYYYEEEPVLATIYENIFVIWTSESHEQEPEPDYTKFEKVEIQTGVCTWNSTGTYWRIQLKLKNTGTASATLIATFINDVEVQNYNIDGIVAGQTSTSMHNDSTTLLSSGESKTINIYIDLGYQTLSHGTTINIKLHSFGGMDYIKLIELI